MTSIDLTSVFIVIVLSPFLVVILAMIQNFFTSVLYFPLPSFFSSSLSFSLFFYSAIPSFLIFSAILCFVLLHFPHIFRFPIALFYSYYYSFFSSLSCAFLLLHPLLFIPNFFSLISSSSSSVTSSLSVSFISLSSFTPFLLPPHFFLLHLFLPLLLFYFYHFSFFISSSSASSSHSWSSFFSFSTEHFFSSKIMNGEEDFKE